MTDQCIVLLGPNAVQCELARRRGLTVIILDTPARLAPDVIGLADHVILTDYSDTELAAALLRPFLERYALLGVLSLTEYGLLPAARLNSFLGLVDNDVKVVERVVYKDRMRAWLASDEHYRLPAALVASPQDLGAFVEDTGLPVILKPVDGAGSEGIILIDSDSALARWESTPHQLPVLAERFVIGTEYSVEAYSRDGEHSIVAVTEKLVHKLGTTNQFVESGHCVPARLDESMRQSIEIYVRDFLSFMGIRWGLSHTEVIATDTGFAIIETHTRNGGDRIVDLVRQATGVDLIDVAIAIRADQDHQPETIATPQAAAVRFFLTQPGVIRSIAGTYAARSAPGVVDLQLFVRPGDRIGEISSSDDRIGMVVAIGANAAEASARAEDAAAAIQFTTH